MRLLRGPAAFCCASPQTRMSRINRVVQRHNLSQRGLAVGAILSRRVTRSVKKSGDRPEWAERARPLQALTITIVGVGHSRPDSYSMTFRDNLMRYAEVDFQIHDRQREKRAVDA